jgi:hypothetical protein
VGATQPVSARSEMQKGTVRLYNFMVAVM